MSYLLDKKTKRNKSIKILLGVIIFIFIFYFRGGIFSGLSYVSLAVFRPLLNTGNNVGAKIQNLGAYFSSKDSLSKENIELKQKIEEDRADRTNYDSVVAENIELKDILGRKSENTPMVLAVVLTKPNQSIYDTLVIDIGGEQGIKVGDRVFAFGNIPIGYIAEVYQNSSKVILYSNSGEKMQAVVKEVSMEIVGRGGGNFEMIMPRDFTLLKGDQVVLPSINTYVVAIVETIISDSRDAFQKAILVSPVNIQGLKFVQVEL